MFNYAFVEYLFRELDNEDLGISTWKSLEVGLLQVRKMMELEEGSLLLRFGKTVLNNIIVFLVLEKKLKYFPQKFIRLRTVEIVNTRVQSINIMTLKQAFWG